MPSQLGKRQLGGTHPQAHIELGSLETQENGFQSLEKGKWPVFSAPSRLTAGEV